MAEKGREDLFKALLNEGGADKEAPTLSGLLEDPKNWPMLLELTEDLAYVRLPLNLMKLRLKQDHPGAVFHYACGPVPSVALARIEKEGRVLSEGLASFEEDQRKQENLRKAAQGREPYTGSLLASATAEAERRALVNLGLDSTTRVRAYWMTPEGREYLIRVLKGPDFLKKIQEEPGAGPAQPQAGRSAASAATPPPASKPAVRSQVKGGASVDSQLKRRVLNQLALLAAAVPEAKKELDEVTARFGSIEAAVEKASLEEVSASYERANRAAAGPGRPG